MISFGKQAQLDVIENDKRMVTDLMKYLPQLLDPSKNNKDAKTLYQAIDHLLTSYSNAAASLATPQHPNVLIPMNLQATVGLPVHDMPDLVKQSAAPVMTLAQAIIDYTQANYKYDVVNDCYPDARFKLGKHEFAVNHSANHVLRAWQKLNMLDYKAAKEELTNDPQDMANVELTQMVQFH